MTMMQRVLMTVPAALGFMACSDPAGVAMVENVTIQAVESGVMIENSRSARIVYTVLDAGFAARANWAPCVHPDCPSILPNEQRRVPAEEIGGWRESDEVIAYWWHVYPTPDGGYYRDEIRAIRVHY